MYPVQRVSKPKLCEPRSFSIKYLESRSLALETIFYYLDLEAVLFSSLGDAETARAGPKVGKKLQFLTKVMLLKIIYQKMKIQIFQKRCIFLGREPCPDLGAQASAGLENKTASRSK